MRDTFIKDIQSTINSLQDKSNDNNSGVEKLTRLSYRQFGSTKLLIEQQV